jgi:putative Holliday junction resolvase
VRVVGVDVGLRRIGLALSDPTGLLASPWKTIKAVGDPSADAELVSSVLREVDQELQAVVVGHPRRLDGTPTGLTGHVESFAAALRARLTVPVALQDERLTSHEADTLLAAREKNWRKRKGKLDELAAAILLQDYLDGIR